MPSVEHTPLLVNLLRLIRNGRSSNYEDHERGPVLFRFGGLEMSDTGPFTLAQIVWENAAWESMQSLELLNKCSETFNSNKNINEYSKPRVSDKATIVNSSFAGSLHLAVYIDGVQVELWTVEDYRERYTENSIPRNLNEIEELNSLVRIIYYHLRMQAVYGEIVQRCTRSVMLQNTNLLNNAVNNHNNFVHGEHACEPHYGYEEQEPTHQHHHNTLHTERENNSLCNNTGIELCVYSHSTEHFPHVKSDYHHSELWAIEDLVRVTVVSDLLWESHIYDKMAMLNTPIALSTESLSQDVNKEADGEHACDALIPCHECALPSPHSIKISHYSEHEEEEQYIPEPLSACSCSDFTSFTPTSANATDKALPTLALPSPMVSTINKTNSEKASSSLLSTSTSSSPSLPETTETAQKQEESVMHSSQDKVYEQSNICTDNNGDHIDVHESEQIQFQQLVHRMGHVFVKQSLLNFDALNKIDNISRKICVNPSTLTEEHEQYVNKTEEENTSNANTNMMAGNINSITKGTSINQKCTSQSSSSSNEKSIISIDNSEQRNDNNIPQKLLAVCSHTKLQDCNKVTVAELLQYQLPAVFT